MKEITIEHAKFKDMKDKMIKVLANLEDMKSSKDAKTKDAREEGKDIHITLQMMIDEMTEALKLATGRVHGSSEPEILKFPHREEK